MHLGQGLQMKLGLILKLLREEWLESKDRNEDSAALNIHLKCSFS